MSSPTARSLKYLRDQGYHADVVERWLPKVKVRRDLFGFCDIVAVKPGEPMTLVQTTTVSNQSARLKKIDGNKAAEVCHKVGCRIVVHGWALKGPRGKRKTWQVTVTVWPGEGLIGDQPAEAREEE